MKYIYLLLCSLMFITSCSQPKAGYSGEDISSKVVVLKNKQAKQTTVQVTMDEEWKLYAGTSVETIETTTPILQGNESGIFPIEVDGEQKYYYLFTSESGSAIITERLLPLEGAYNFRDLGGIPTKEGRYIKWGTLFRSGDLSTLTQNDIAYLRQVGLHSLVDFRTNEEVEQAPNVELPFVTSYKLPIAPGNLGASLQSDLQNKTTAELDSFMMLANQSFALDTEIIKQYQSFFRLLQEENHLPLVFHCSAGKDRTGMGAALFLYSLGVEEELIFQDYLASNIYLEDKYAPYTQKYPNLTALFSVKPEFLKAGFDAIKDTYGSIDHFLENTLEVDRAVMKSIYLY